jgi:two-component system, sensor histidine kinase LadS
MTPLLEISNLDGGGDETRGNDSYRSLNINFTLAPRDLPRDIWLRIKTSSTFLFDAQVLTFDGIAATDLKQSLTSGFYVALISLYIVWGVLHWWSSRDPIIGIFTFKEVLCLIYVIGYLGYFSAIWPVDWQLRPGALVDLSLAPYVAASCYFDYRLLREYRPNRALLNLLKGMTLILPVYLIFWWVDEKQTAFMLNMGLAGLAPVLAFCTAMTANPMDGNERRSMLPMTKTALLSLYGLILLSLSVSTLPALGLVDAGDYVFDGFLSYSLFIGLAVLVALEVRIRSNERQRTILETEHREMQRRYQAEHERREHQSQFLAMLTHELKTPLSVVQMTIAVAEKEENLKRASDAIQEMASIIERCLTADQMEGGKIEPTLVDCNLTLEIQRMVEKCSEPDRVDIKSPETHWMKTDPFLLRIVLANLIDNALKYGAEGSRVKLEIDEEESTLIRIENCPCQGGWPDPSRLFERYYRAPSALRQSGTGLGLYVSLRAMQALGGDLRYTPSATQVCFTVCLPRST